MTAGASDSAARPNALVLWSPGVGSGDAYFRGLFAGRADGQDFFPMKHIRPPAPPTIIISGALDVVTADSDARQYCARLMDAKGRCEFHSYPNLGHILSRRLDAQAQQQGDFDPDPIATRDADEKIWAFLQSLGYIKQ